MSRKPSGKVLSGDDLEALERLNGRNWPDARIARTLKCSRRTILRHRKAMQLPAVEHPSKGDRAGERIVRAKAIQAMRDRRASDGGR